MRCEKVGSREGNTNGEAVLGFGEFLQQEELSQELLLTSSQARK